MGDCIYCQKDAGFLRTKHSQCEALHEDGKKNISTMLLNAFQQGIDFFTLDSQLRAIATQNYVSSDKLRNIFLDTFDIAIVKLLDDGVISDNEKRVIARYIQYTQIPQGDFNKKHSLEKVVQSDILQSVLNGVIPTPSITMKQPLPFMFAKDEKLMWVYRDVELVEQKIKREFVGRSQGVSFRVMKGVYYRVGNFKGTPVETTQMVSIGWGILALTDKHIYFNCPQKSIKTPYKKLISIEPYSDGIGFQKDGNSSKPFFIKGIDSWFAYNLIINLQNI